MAIKLGSFSVNKIYLGVSEITKAYLGSTEVYSVGGVDTYAVAGFSPALVTDFSSDYYRTSSNDTTFDTAVTHARNSNATMVDSDGLLKWAPHNFLTYSEQFDNAAWVKTTCTIDINAGVDSSGNFTADRIVPDVGLIGWASQAFTALIGVKYTVEFVAERSGYDLQVFFGGSDVSGNPYVNFNLANGTIASDSNNLGAITDLGNGLYLCSLTFDAAQTSISVALSPINNTGNTRAQSFSSDGVSGVLISSARAYRSDLGGMVDNPDRGDSYVPTTTSARYLPRRGHHVYNGTTWVNEGLLVESEQRINLIEYSNDFADAYWAKARISISANVSGQISPDGTANVSKLVENSDNEARSIYRAFSFTNTASASVWVKSAGDGRLLRFQAGTTSSYFDPDTGLWGTTVPKHSNHQVENWGNGWYRVSLTYDGSEQDFFALGLAEADGVSAYQGDGTSGIYIYGAQFEAGSTPSSYIPNAGTSGGVTRAAETLTVPAAQLPWPVPNVIGSELVTNGTFDTDISDWNSVRSGILSHTGSAIQVETSTETFGIASYEFSTTVGSVYQVTAELVSANAGSYVVIGTSSTNYIPELVRIIDNATTQEVATGYFVATTTTTYINLLAGSVSGNTAVFDNISVKEIDPLSVSIQMDGRMTYADGDVLQYFSWQFDGNNFIRNELAANFTPDRVRFRQAASAVFDNVDNTSGVYSPGTNVPYNIASRHGSTFINGAVDGTALTADTTPTALPDLSANDLNLAYDYMGTVKLFRVWANDLGDDGIEEASTYDSLLGDYSGAAAAYSLRDLVGTNPNVVKVRRSSDNAEADFNAYEVQGGALETWVGANDGFVVTWYDQSGNSNNATQVTASAQPKIVSSGVLITENGKAVLDFDGVNDQLLINQSALNFGNGSTDSPISIFSVLKKSPIGQTFPILAKYVGTSVNQGAYAFTLDSNEAFQAAVIDNQVSQRFSVGTSSTFDDTNTLVSFYYNNLSFDIFVNSLSQQLTDSSDGTYVAMEVEAISASIGAQLQNYTVKTFGQGQLQELIVYGSDQSSNRTGIETNINDYYGIY